MPRELKPHFLVTAAERREIRYGVLEVIDYSVAIVLVIHGTQFRIGVEHRLLGLHTFVGNQFTAEPHPGLAVERTELRLRIRGQLSGDALLLARLDVELAVEDVDCAEWPDTWLVAIHSGDVVGLAGLDELIYFLHTLLS